MNIRLVNTRPEPNQLDPAIEFDFEIEQQHYKEAVIGVSGWLKTNDEKIIGELKEAHKPKSSNETEIGATGTIYDDHNMKTKYTTALVAVLNEKAIEHIKKLRMHNIKKSVLLTVSIKVIYLMNKAFVSPIFGIKPTNLGLRQQSITFKDGKTTKNWVVLLYSSGGIPYKSTAPDTWILSGNNGPGYLIVKEAPPVEFHVEIKEPDWIHDYAPVLGLGEYFVVEISKGEKTIEDAWKYVEKAENSFMNWNTKGVYGNCREAGKVLDKAIKEKFGGDSFTYNERWGRAYLRFFNYLSSLNLHLEDMKGMKWEEVIKNLPSGFPHPKKSGDYPEDEIKKFGKSDAEHLLITTKALIKYAEELLKEKTGD